MFPKTTLCTFKLKGETDWLTFLISLGGGQHSSRLFM